VAERIDLFRRALAGAARAIARDADVDVVFASDTAPASGKTARVPSPGPALEPRLVAEARGAADSVALRLRHHDSKLHARHAPADADARAVFDALETARVEALGARAMGGVRENLNHLAEARVRRFAKIVEVAGAHLDLAPADIAHLAQTLRGDPDNRGPIAFVVAANRGAFARQFAASTAHEGPVGVFHSLHEARAWIAKTQQAGSQAANSPPTPQAAEYKGSGDLKDGANWSCKAPPSK